MYVVNHLGMTSGQERQYYNHSSIHPSIIIFMAKQVHVGADRPPNTLALGHLWLHLDVPERNSKVNVIPVHL